ncbi:MAG: DUF4479 domain-containing protein [Bacilli bacterium]|jgi:hypothetical protein|nr:putative tRNA-binding domain protein [Firmicutes bacterium CAG:345]
MSTEVSLFYNQEACKDVLILIADESSYPDKVEKYEDVIILKNKDRIVGINILNSLEYVKIKASGLIHSVNEQLAKLIENIVKDYSDYDIKVVDNNFILGQIKENLGKNQYKIDIGLKESVLAISNIGELNIGEFVEVSYKETRLPTGHKAYHYLKGLADYLITNKDLKPDVCGTKLYILESSKKH